MINIEYCSWLVIVSNYPSHTNVLKTVELTIKASGRIIMSLTIGMNASFSCGFLLLYKILTLTNCMLTPEHSPELNQ